jgi:hypothetical protein
VVHAWNTEAHVLLGMTATARAPGELEATRAMLAWLDVRGAVLTIDANGCCRENSRPISAPIAAGPAKRARGPRTIEGRAHRSGALHRAAAALEGG